MIMGWLIVAALPWIILAVVVHLWFSTQTLRSRWHDIHPHRRKV